MGTLTTKVEARIDSKIKSEAKDVLNDLGMSISEAINIFFRQIVLSKGIPFEVKIPNALTQKTLEESEQGVGLRKAENLDGLFKELDA